MGVLDSLYRLFGADPPTVNVDVPRQRTYPTEEDAREAMRVDATYGTDVAPMLAAGGAKIRKFPTNQHALRELNAPAEARTYGEPGTLTDEQRLQLMRAFLGSQRSPVAALGFDPRAMTLTPKNAGWPLNVYGIYDRKNDRIWYDARDDSTPVHESMHRGMQRIFDSGKKTLVPEEQTVRALMSRYFGPVEMTNEGLAAAGDKKKMGLGDQQVQEGMDQERNFPRWGDEVERLALELLQKRGRPMGPR